MFIDIILALWFVSLFAIGGWAYFKGAERQLDICAKRRHEETTDSRWKMEVDIGKSRRKF